MHTQLATLTVLHVDDNVIDRLIIREAFADRPGFRLMSAPSATEALALASVDVPDVILLDLHLGDATAADLLSRLRADQRLTRVPVVVLSADDRNATRRELREAGVFGYLTKPVDIDMLIALVTSASEEHAA